MRKALLIIFLLSILMLWFFPQVYAAMTYPGNHCLEFDGTDDYVSCNGPDVQAYRAERLTVELWVRPKYTIENGSDAKYGLTSGALVSYTETWASQGGWTLYFDFSNGYLSFRYRYLWYDPYTGQSSKHTGIASTNRRIWNANSWYHIAITYDHYPPNDCMIFRVNRTIDKTYSDVNPLHYEAASLMVGGHPTQGYMFGGSIDEVRVWNVSRTHSEILNSWDRVLNQTECAQSELIGCWRFDEGAGDIAEDFSIQDNNALLALEPYNPTWADLGAPIVPEFPTLTTMLLLFITLTAAIAFYKRRLLRTPIH